MSSINYKQKYLKYKNKYLELKTQQELQYQTGGFAYTPGKYLFFIPDDKSNFDTQKPNELGEDYKSILVDTKGKIVGSLDSLTDYLGNCTKFLRVGKTSSGYDFANTYNTIYSNQSSSNVIRREAKDSYVAAKPYIDTVVDTTKKVAEQSWNTAKQVGNKIGEQAQKIMEKNPEKRDEINNNEINNNEINNNEQTGGDGNGDGNGDCVREPIKIKDKKFLIGDVNDVRPDKLKSIIEIINEETNNKSNNKITRIILVEKPIIPGKSSTIDLERNYVVSYDSNNNVIIDRKK
jgi:hypothetical protein